MNTYRVYIMNISYVTQAASFNEAEEIAIVNLATDPWCEDENIDRKKIEEFQHKAYKIEVLTQKEIDEIKNNINHQGE